jgi:hypothetical protein
MNLMAFVAESDLILRLVSNLALRNPFAIGKARLQFAHGLPHVFIELVPSSGGMRHFECEKEKPFDVPIR